MLVYRIGHKDYATRIEASGRDGRWTSGGRKVVYAASSFALAYLENMYYRRGAGFNDDYRTVLIYVPDDLGIMTLLEDDLPAGWRNPTNYPHSQSIGNKWYDELHYPLLKVPSAVITPEYNFLFNTLHTQFSKVRILEVANFLPDSRIDYILKQQAIAQK